MKGGRGEQRWHSCGRAGGGTEDGSPTARRARRSLSSHGAPFGDTADRFQCHRVNHNHRTTQTSLQNTLIARYCKNSQVSQNQ